jgi:alpha-tubulin suppressor-like RCC1 family protein
MKNPYLLNALIFCCIFLTASVVKAQTIAAGAYFSFAICNNHTLMSWGDNGSGQLGNGSWNSVTLPVNVTGLNGIIAIAEGGGNHALALQDNGALWAWGANMVGSLEMVRRCRVIFLF